VVYKFDQVKVNKKSQHLAQVMKKHLMNILQTEVNDPRVKWVTVNDVQINKDKSLVMVYYSVLGAEKEMQEADLALKAAKGFIRSKLSSRLTIYKTPSLKFIFDIAAVYNHHSTMNLEAVDVAQDKESTD
jgi:ribosome-binding factor A